MAAPKSCMVDDCRSIEIIISALYDYQLINDSEFSDIKQYVCKIKTQTTMILDAYHHILFCHLNGSRRENNVEFEKIYHKIAEKNINCNINICKKYIRNQRDRDNELRNDTDIKNEIDEKNDNHSDNSSLDIILNDNLEKTDIFHIDILDTIHSYFMHSYDAGFRINIKDLQDRYGIHDTNFVANNEKRLYKDDELLDIQQIINKRRININRNMRREQRSMNNRFRMQYQNEKKSMTNNINIKQNNDDEEKTEEHKQAVSGINNSVKAQKQSTNNCYSFGHRFYYWEWYKNRDEEDVEYNIGYSYCEWYIDRKYKNLKEELLDNEISNLDQNKWDKTMFEVKMNMPSIHRKQLLSDKRGKKLHYGIKAQETISIEHLLSVKLYTSFDVLSFKFSTTFRKLNKNESNKQLKERNAQYSNWSRLLRETVECFGTRVDESAIKIFYHGNRQFICFCFSFLCFCFSLSVHVYINNHKTHIFRMQLFNISIIHC